MLLAPNMEVSKKYNKPLPLAQITAELKEHTMEEIGIHLPTSMSLLNLGMG